MTTTKTTDLTAYTFVPEPLRRELWDMYLGAFLPMRTEAAQRHVLFHDEWTELMDDDRVTKIVTHQGDVPVGLAVVTNDLLAVPLIEPEFFRAREPELAEAGRIWYVLFVCERQDEPKPPKDNFRMLIEKVAEPIRPVRGVCYMDYAARRVLDGLPDKANLLLRLGCAEADFEQVDAQTYWGYYPGGRP